MSRIVAADPAGADGTARSRRRLALVAIAILACLPFHRLVAHPGWLPLPGIDVVEQLSVHHEALRQALAHDEAPWWNPWRGCGMPQFANPQSWALHPLSAVAMVAPPDRGYGLMFALLAIVSGCGTLAWLSSREIPLAAALVGATMMALDGKLLAHAAVGNLNMVAAAAWFPWILLLYERTLAPFDRRYASGTALLLVIAFLGGHVQEWYYLVLALAVLAVAELLPRRGNPIDYRNLSRRAAHAALPIALVLPALALWLVPAIELGHWTSREGGLTIHAAADQSVTPTHLLGLVTPAIFGWIGHDTWGPINPWERYLYIGVLPLILAPVGALGLWRSGRRIDRAYVLLAIVGALFTTGGLVFRVAFDVIPGMGLFRIPARMLFVVRPIVALLAAEGVAVLIARTTIQRRVTSITLAIGATLIVTSAWIQGHATELARPFANWIAARMVAGDFDFLPSAVVAGRALHWLTDVGHELTLQAAVALLCGLAVGAIPLAPTLRRARWSACLLTAALALDLLRAGLPMIRAGESPTISEDSPLLQELGARARRESPFRVLDLTDAPRYTAALRQGVELLNVYDPVILDPILRLTNLQVGGSTAPKSSTWLPIESLAIRDDTDLRPLSLLNVRYLLTDHTVEHPRLIETASQADGRRLYRFLDDGPRARLVPTARWFPATRDGENAVLNGLIASDPTREVLLLGDPPSDSAVHEDARPEPAPGDVEWLRRTANRVELSVRAPAGGWLVVAQTYFPGWRATVDGHPAVIERAQLAFQAVAVQPGTHVVELEFAPVHIGLAFAVSLVGFAAIATGLMRSRRSALPGDSSAAPTM